MNYTWTNHDLNRNNFISAYALGGQQWLDTVYASQIAAKYTPENELRQARDEALIAAQDDRKWIESNSKHNLEELLAGFKNRQIPH